MNITDILKSSLHKAIKILIPVIFLGSIIAWGYREEWIAWWHGIYKLAIFAGVCVLTYMGILLFEQKFTQGTTSMTRASFWLNMLLMAAISLLYLNIWSSPLQLPVTTLGSTGFIFLLFALLGRWCLVIWIPFLYIQIVQAVSFSRLGVRFSSGIFAEIIHASHAEIMSFVTFQNILAIILAFFVAFATGILQYRTIRKIGRTCLAKYGFVLLACFYFLLAFVPHNSRISLIPYPVEETHLLISAGDLAIDQDVHTLLLVKQLPSPADSPSESPLISKVKGVVCILHIGESVLANHLQINGYHRSTTPWLSRQKDLINFPRCTSLYHQTTSAIIGILTDGAREEANNELFGPVAPKIGIVADLFEKHGFYTGMLAALDSIHQKHQKYRYTYGEVMQICTRRLDTLMEAPGGRMTQANQLLDLCRKHPDENMFIILNNEGSHSPFFSFNSKSPAFTPYDNTSFCTNPQPHKQEITNAYDNTIVELDAYVQRIAEGLKGRAFLYIYVSDHGEFLGENDKWGRSWIFSERDSVKGLQAYRKSTGSQVGMFILPSEEWLQLHPHFQTAAQQLKANSGMTVCHAHIFDTVLGLFGISSSHYDARWDLTSPLVQEYKGAQPSTAPQQYKLRQFPCRAGDMRD